MGVLVGVVLSPIQLGLYWLLRWSTRSLLEPLSLPTKLAGVAWEVTLWAAVGVTAILGFFGIVKFLRLMCDDSGGFIGSRTRIMVGLLGTVTACALGFALIHWDCALALCLLLPVLVLVILGAVLLWELTRGRGHWVIMLWLTLSAAGGAIIGLFVIALGGSDWARLLVCGLLIGSLTAVLDAMEKRNGGR